MHEPWRTLLQVAEHTLKLYNPGDDSEDLGRCDIQLLLDGLTAALMTLQGTEDTPEGNRDAVPIEAVAAVLRSYQAVLRGLFGDLRDLGPKAVWAIYVLEDALLDDSLDLSTAAAEALAAIGPKAVDSFITAMDSQHDVVRQLAVEATRRLGLRHDLPGEQVMPIYLAAMRDENNRVRSFGAVGAGDLGRAGYIEQEAIDALIELLADEDLHNAALAAWSLSLIGPPAADAVDALISMMQTESGRNQGVAAVALAKIAPTDNANVEPALIGLLAHEGSHQRWSAAWALGELGLGEQSIPSLIEALADEDDTVRAGAANALSKIRTGVTDESPGQAASAQAVDELTQMLYDDDTHVRWAAIWALGEAGDAAVGTVGELLAILDNTRSPQQLRAAAANALGKIGPVDARIRSALTAATTDDDPTVRKVAAERLEDSRWQLAPPQ